MYSESPLTLWLAKAEAGDVTAQACVSGDLKVGSAA